jgi:patatin-like phospholipase/acyl hydrolase
VVENPFQMLTLSGGGYLGLFTATVLAELEKSIQRPIAQSFNLLSGTSIGGIIALGLAAGKSASDIKAAFETNGAEIFGEKPPPTSRFGRYWDLLRSALSSKYSEFALRETIESIVGKKTRIGDLQHAVLIPAINLSKGSPQIFKTPHHLDFRTDLNLRVVDVALATSAAPTIFPLAKIGDSLFTDGGLYANSPDLLALHEARHFFKIEEERIRVLSIGTTTSQFSFAATKEKDFGIINWFEGQRLLNVMIASQQRSTDFMLRHRLRDRYVRIDALQSKEQERILGLDVATEAAQQTIRALASNTVQDTINNSMLQQILSTQATPVRFFHRVAEQG